MEKMIRLDKNEKIKVVTGTLCEFVEECSNSFSQEGDSLLVFGNEKLGPLGMMNQFRNFKVHQTKYPFWMRFKRKFSVLNSVAMAAILTLFVGFLGAYGNAFYEVLIKKEYDQTLLLLNGNELFFLMNVIFFLVIFLAPQLISSDFTSINQWIEKRFSNREKIYRQMTRELIPLLDKQNTIKRIKLINPWHYPQAQSLFMEHLGSRLIKDGYVVEWHVRNDEVSETIELISQQNNTTFSTPKKDDEVDTHKSAGANNLQLEERKIVCLLIFCSTYINAGKSNVQNSSYYELSTELAALVIERYRDKLMDFQSIDKAKLYRVVQRCIHDYNLITVDKVADNLRYRILFPEGLMFDQKDFNQLRESLKLDVAELKEELDDTISSLILFSFFLDDTYLNKHKKIAAELFISNLLEQEQYIILHKYGHLLFSADNTVREKDVYRVLSAENLLKIGVLGLKAGYYDEAMKACSSASLVYPVKANIGMVRIMERRGNYRQALEAICEVEKRCDTKEMIYLEDKIACLELLLEKAWIIVSARFSDNREQGRKANQEAGKILDQLGNITYDLNYLYSYHNNLANYHEWDGDYQEAINSYEKILAIPGMNIQPISSVMINIGIAQRLQAMCGQEKDKRICQLSRSAEYLIQGVDLKRKIGDHDQFPVAIHNLAETTILQAFEVKGQKDGTKLFEMAYNYAMEGLGVQQKIGSIKKRGQLLSEAFVALNFMRSDSKRELTDLSNALVQWHEKYGEQHAFDWQAVCGMLLPLGYSKEMNLNKWLIEFVKNQG